MELNEFVRLTLTEIAKGVADSQEPVRDLGGYASPAMYPNLSAGDSTGYFGRLSSGQNVLLVNFDVAVTVNDSVSGDVGAKLSVVSMFKAGAESQQRWSSESTNRISFKVPLALPNDPETTARLNMEEAEAEHVVQSNRPIYG